MHGPSGCVVAATAGALFVLGCLGVALGFRSLEMPRMSPCQTTEYPVTSPKVKSAGARTESQGLRRQDPGVRDHLPVVPPAPDPVSSRNQSSCEPSTPPPLPHPNQQPRRTFGGSTTLYSAPGAQTTPASPLSASLSAKRSLAAPPCELFSRARRRTERSPPPPEFLLR